MKSLNKISHLVIVAILFLGTLYSGFVLFNLTTDIEQASGKIDLNVINEASSVFNKVYLVVGITLLIGLISSVWLLNQIMTQKEQVITSSAENSKTTDRKTEVVDEEKETFDKTVRDIQSTATGLKDEKEKYEKLLAKLCMKLEASQGLVYEVKKNKNKRIIELMTSFAFILPESETLTYEFGEGLAGQVAKEGKKVNIDDIPEGYITIVSGLGSASPNHLAIIPVMDGKEVIHVVEIASFKGISEADEKLIAEIFKAEKEKKSTTAGATKKVEGKESKSKN